MINSIPSQQERAVTPPETGQPLLTRGLAVVGLVGITLCHLVQLPSTFRESPALGWLFAALSLVAGLLAAGLVRADHQLLWYLAGLTAAGALAGYALTRLGTGLDRALPGRTPRTSPRDLNVATPPRRPRTSVESRAD